MVTSMMASHSSHIELCHQYLCCHTIVSVSDNNKLLKCFRTMSFWRMNSSVQVFEMLFNCFSLHFELANWNEWFFFIFRMNGRRIYEVDLKCF